MARTGDLLYIPVHYYDVSGNTILSDLGTDVIIFPYWPSTHPSTGDIVSYGLATSLFTDWGNAISGFQMAGMRCKPVYGPNPYEHFQSYFPNVKPTSCTQLAIENLQNGMFLVYGASTGAAHRVYSSKETFLNGGSSFGTVSSTGGFVDMSSNSAAYRGRAYLLYYRSFNEETQTITGLEVIEFYGCTSTQNNIAVHSYDSTGNSTLYAFLGNPNSYNPEPSGNEPYSENGNTEPGGSGGIGYDNIINDDVDFPSTPTASAANANFISIWTPTLEQVQTLASWMWTTDILKKEFWQKLLQNPLELIFSLSIMPIPIFHTDDSGTISEGEIEAYADSLSLGWQDTGILMDWIPDQYVTLDMGSIDLEEVWGAFLDYEPYTKIDIFLPYIGTKQLDTNDCMPRTIGLRYVIDLATGTCVAMVKCDNSVYYHFSGNCASQIPITVNQCQEIMRGLMTMAVGAATFAVGGAMGAGAHVSKAVATKGLAMQAGGASMVGRGADNAAKGVNVSRSGTIGCAAGLMDIQTPYLIISRPRQAIPEEQNKYTGYPSFITELIGDLTGYTEVQIIHLENMTCTDEEYEEINALLLEGVII